MSKEELNAKTPVAPIDMTKDLCCPLLGMFGNDDRAPSPEQVNQHEAELKKHGKTYEFHRYDGAGHGFFYWHRPLYRPEQAWMAGARYSPSSASIWRSRRAGHVHVHHRDRPRGGHGKARGRMVPADRRRWSPMTTRAMRRLGDVITLDFINTGPRRRCARAGSS